jgi:hypothetical protein
MCVPVDIVGEGSQIFLAANGTFVCYSKKDRRLFFVGRQCNDVILFPVLSDGTVQRKTNVFTHPAEGVFIFLSNQISGLQVVDEKIVWSDETVTD